MWTTQDRLMTKCVTYNPCTSSSLPTVRQMNDYNSKQVSALLWLWTVSGLRIDVFWVLAPPRIIRIVPPNTQHEFKKSLLFIFNIFYLERNLNIFGQPIKFCYLKLLLSPILPSLSVRSRPHFPLAVKMLVYSKQIWASSAHAPRLYHGYVGMYSYMERWTLRREVSDCMSIRCADVWCRIITLYYSQKSVWQFQLKPCEITNVPIRRTASSRLAYIFSQR